MGAEYKREWKKRKKLEADLLVVSGGNGSDDWEDLKKLVRGAIGKKGDIKSPLVAIYKDILKVERAGKVSNEISIDEIAKRNLEAERELREGGY